MHSGLCGKRHGAGQRQGSIRWGAAYVATAVVIDDSALGRADQWFQGYRRHSTQIAWVAVNSLKCLAGIEAPDALGAVVGGPVAQVVDERLQQERRLRC